MAEGNCYLDYNASTPVHPEVLDCYTKVLDFYANPASLHEGGINASNEIQAARKIISKSLNCSPDEVWFTSGGTESNNWIIKGFVQNALKAEKKHLITSTIEHKSILRSANYVSDAYNLDLTLLSADGNGKVNPEELIGSIREDTFLVSIMLANNETGIIQPIQELAKVCRERGVLFHTDAVCSLGKIHIDFQELGVDALSLSGHKLYTPKGIGVLILKKGIDIDPLINGCGQQSGMRSGTENAAGATSFAKAFELLENGTFYQENEISDLTQELQQQIITAFGSQAIFHGNGDRLGNTLNVGFEGISATYLQEQLSQKGIFVSAGAAAATGDPSHVLTAMGISKELAQSTLRITLGWGNSEDDIQYFIKTLSGIFEQEKVLS